MGTRGVCWIEEGNARTGEQWGEARGDGCVWVLPHVPERHEECVLLEPRYGSQTGYVWRATVYEDHVRGNVPTIPGAHCPPKWATFGCVEGAEEYDCQPLCKPDCGIQLVRPGKYQCDCESE